MFEIKNSTSQVKNIISDLVYFFLFLYFSLFWRGHKNRRVDLGGMRSKYDQNVLYEIFK